MNARSSWIGAEQEHAAHGRVTARALWLQKGGMTLLAGGLTLLGVALLVQLLSV